MKRFFVVWLLCAATLFGSELFVIKKSGKIEHFIRYEESSINKASSAQPLTSECYYKAGIVMPQNCYKMTGNLIVRFTQGDERDFRAFGLKHALEFKRILNQEARSVLFGANGQNIADTLLQFTDEPLVRNIEPEWIKPRRLR